MDTQHETGCDAEPTPRPVQPPGPAAALGLAVSHLTTKPVFARLGFGS